MIIFVDVKVVLHATCVMVGNNSLIIPYFIKLINAKIRTVEKDHVQITILKKKEEL